MAIQGGKGLMTPQLIISSWKLNAAALHEFCRNVRIQEKIELAFDSNGF